MKGWFISEVDKSTVRHFLVQERVAEAGQNGFSQIHSQVREFSSFIIEKMKVLSAPLIILGTGYVSKER